MRIPGNLLVRDARMLGRRTSLSENALQGRETHTHTYLESRESPSDKFTNIRRLNLALFSDELTSKAMELHLVRRKTWCCTSKLTKIAYADGA